MKSIFCKKTESTISLAAFVCGAAFCLLAPAALAASAATSGTDTSVSIGAEPATDAGPSIRDAISATGEAPPQQGVFNTPGVVARIGKTDVKIEDLRAAIHNLDPDEQTQIARSPEFLQRAVRSILVEQLILNEVSATKWEAKPDVAARLEQLRKTSVANSYIRAMARPPDDYPSDAELQSAYNARKEALSVPHKFHVAQIFVAVPISAEKDKQEKAHAKVETILKSLNQPNTDFGVIAGQESDEAATAGAGGDMGWVSDRKMPARIHISLLSLRKDQVSQPIRLEDGWHILKLLEVNDIFPLTFADVKARLAQQLRAERARENFQAFLAKLLKENPVTVDDKSLPQLINKPEK
jgi:parvulin-like peptidyl-prolyl isomerase